MKLFPNNCTTNCFFVVIIELKLELLNAQVFLFWIFLKSEKHYFYIFPENFHTFFRSSFYIENLTLLRKTNEKLKLLTLFLLYSIVVKYCFLA